MNKIQKELLFCQIDIYQINNLANCSPTFHLKIFMLDIFLNFISVFNTNLKIKNINSINNRYIEIIDK
jgi:hypothetical protein